MAPTSAKETGTSSRRDQSNGSDVRLGLFVRAFTRSDRFTEAFRRELAAASRISRRTIVFYFAQDSVVAALIIALRAFHDPFLRDVSGNHPLGPVLLEKPEHQRRRLYTYLYVEDKKVPWRGIK